MKPVIELARLSGFKVKRNASAVSEQMVTDQIAELRDQKATWTPVEEKPREGDMVTVQKLAVADETGIVPEGKEYRIVLGSGQAIAAIEEVIDGARPRRAATSRRSVKWPDDFPDAEQAGKSKQVRVALSDVKRKALPELDDALARELGDFDLARRAHQGGPRGSRGAGRSRGRRGGAHASLIDEDYRCECIRRGSPTWVRDLVSHYAEAYRIPAEEQEKFATEFRSMAERQVRRDLIVETIAQREKLVAEEKDVDAKVAEMAAKRGADAGQVYSALQKARTASRRSNAASPTTACLSSFLPRIRSNRQPQTKHQEETEHDDHPESLRHRALKPRRAQYYDVYSRLLMDRIIFLGTSINDDVANMIIAQMLFLDALWTTRGGTSTCISTRRAASSRAAWRSMTPCRSSGRR